MLLCETWHDAQLHHYLAFRLSNVLGYAPVTDIPITKTNTKTKMVYRVGQNKPDCFQS